MKVIFLGTAGYHPTADRQTAAIWLPEVRLLLDAGTSIYRVLAELHGEFHVLLSHAHLDHVCGLTYLAAPLAAGTIGPCHLWCHPSVREIVTQHLFHPGLFPLKAPFQWHDLSQPVTLSGITITTHALLHPGGSWGFRLDRPDGQTLAYITDTQVDERYHEFLNNVDVLIHECHFADEQAAHCPITGHSHLSMVVSLAHALKIPRTYLTHIGPNMPAQFIEEVQRSRHFYPGVQIAHDMLVIDW
ncbi:MAG: ribonuclease Z [Planctomycetaceae bacterium]|nr:MAG: ribonuclease Z [Planctomycetaceae bacterium]